MPTGYTTVSGTQLVDASGTTIKSALISFTPTLANGQPTGFRVNGGGQSVASAIWASVKNGAFTVILADTSLTSPMNICYSVKVFKRSDNSLLLGGPKSGYDRFQPRGAAYNFDNFNPLVPVLQTAKTLPAAVIVADSATGSNVAITVIDGALTTVPLGNAGTLSTTLVLADTDIAQNYALGVSNGTLTLTPVSLSTTAVAQITLGDLGTGNQYVLAVTDGALTLT